MAELKAIIESSASGCGSGSPCIDPAFGPTQASYYWSSSSLAGGPESAWSVAFDVGNANNLIEKIFGYYARAVRSGR